MVTGAHGTAGEAVAGPVMVVRCVATERVTTLDRQMEAGHVPDQTHKSKSAMQPAALVQHSFT